MIVTRPASNPQKCEKTFSDLPHELLDDIFGYLSWEEIISCSTLISKKVQSVVEKDYFWQKRLNAAINLPFDVSKLPQFKGVPVKRIFLAITRARFYTWGESTLGKLGHSYPITGSAVRSHRVPRGIAIPLEIRSLRDVFIVDIKTGGWSTHFLTFNGDVYSFGSMNGHSPSSSKEPVQMKFSDPIVQISAGRNHLVALSSKGEIYSYVDLKSVPQRIKFFEHNIIKSNPRSTSTEFGKVKKVVGGWNCSGALIHGYGIVIWRHEGRVNPRELREKAVIYNPGDNWVHESVITPPIIEALDDKNLELSSRRLPAELEQERNKQIADFIILESYVVFITVGGKVYCVDLQNSLPASEPVLLTNFSTPEPEEGKIVDREAIEKQRVDRISGFFKRFAVYNEHGLVHIGNDEILKNTIEGTRRAGTASSDREEVQPLALPNLRNFGTIVQIVFGDYHSHALTAGGKLLSWGVESMNCGCLGIGDSKESTRRGVVWQHGNGSLDEPAEVFFHDPPYPESSYPRKNEDGTPNWDASASTNPENEEVRLDQREFHVLSITAAGWHSGALVLPITDYLLNGTKSKKTSVHETMPAINSEENINGHPEIFQLLHGSEHEHEFDEDTLGRTRTDHRGIQGISTVATGMRGGLRGRLRNRGRGGMWAGPPGSVGRGQGGEETSEAGERLGESIRIVARGRSRGRGPAID